LSTTYGNFRGFGVLSQFSTPSISKNITFIQASLEATCLARRGHKRHAPAHVSHCAWALPGCSPQVHHRFRGLTGIVRAGSSKRAPAEIILSLSRHTGREEGGSVRDCS
jgi:hypothetical protein